MVETLKDSKNFQNRHWIQWGLDRHSHPYNNFMAAPERRGHVCDAKVVEASADFGSLFVEAWLQKV